jgi:hypothetical protein
VRLRPDVQHNKIKAWMSIAVDGNQTRAVLAYAAHREHQVVSLQVQ